MSGQPPIPPPPPPPPGTPFSPERAGASPVVTNPMAIAGLITGLVGVVLFWTIIPSLILGILAVVFGGVAKGRATRGAPNGGMAVVAIVLGIVAIVGSIVLILFWTNLITSTEVKIDQDGVQINGLILRP